MKRFTALGPCVHGPPIKATIRAPSVHGPPIKATIRAPSVHGPPIKATIRAPAPAIQALSKPEATVKASRVMSRTALLPAVECVMKKISLTTNPNMKQQMNDGRNLRRKMGGRFITSWIANLILEQLLYVTVLKVSSSVQRNDVPPNSIHLPKLYYKQYHIDVYRNQVNRLSAYPSDPRTDMDAVDADRLFAFMVSRVSLLTFACDGLLTVRGFYDIRILVLADYMLIHHISMEQIHLVPAACLLSDQQPATDSSWLDDSLDPPHANGGMWKHVSAMNGECSDETLYLWITVEYGKTYLLRMVNEVMNNILFFSIANYHITVVGSNSSYIKSFKSDYITLSPIWQTIDFLLEANKPLNHYYMAAKAYSSTPGHHSTPPPPSSLWNIPETILHLRHHPCLIFPILMTPIRQSILQESSDPELRRPET
nr:laccase-14-like [Ipomoea batatas]